MVYWIDNGPIEMKKDILPIAVASAVDGRIDAHRLTLVGRVVGLLFFDLGQAVRNGE